MKKHWPAQSNDHPLNVFQLFFLKYFPSFKNQKWKIILKKTLKKLKLNFFLLFFLPHLIIRTLNAFLLKVNHNCKWWWWLTVLMFLLFFFFSIIMMTVVMMMVKGTFFLALFTHSHNQTRRPIFLGAIFRTDTARSET